MTDDPKSYREGFAAGWLAASQAIMEAMMSERPAPPPGLAGNLPAGLRRRRGRPPKSAAAAQPVLQLPGKRRRGRPRKTA